MSKPGLAFEFDPEFACETDADGFPTARAQLAWAFRWLVLGPALVFLAVVLGVGLIQAILPRLKADRLNRPVAVRAIEADTLLLADGRRVALPGLARLPGEDPVFRSAMTYGVEVDGRGEAFGLLKLWATCGMTLEPYHWTRIDLRDLAAAAHPECVDPSAIHPEALALLKEGYSRPYRPGGRLRSYPLKSYCGKWHDAFEYAASR